MTDRNEHHSYSFFQAQKLGALPFIVTAACKVAINLEGSRKGSSLAGEGGGDAA